MIAVLAAAAAVVAAAQPPPTGQPLAEAAHAIEVGRLDQARLMIGNAIKAGAKGVETDRLIADLAFAEKDYRGALARYRPLLAASPNDAGMYERAGISAVRIGDTAEAVRLLQRATSFPQATWRAWNALGVALDFQREWERSDAAYARAVELAPGRAEPLNNMGWSKLVRGQWSEALGLIEKAAALDPKSERIGANLELARAAVSEDLPARRPGESEADWAARLNDAGVIARVQGKKSKAVAAFARAIEARSQWFERAANNLALAESAR